MGFDDGLRNPLLLQGISFCWIPAATYSPGFTVRKGRLPSPLKRLGILPCSLGFRLASSPTGRARLRPLQVKRFAFHNIIVPLFPRYLAQERESELSSGDRKTERPLVSGRSVFGSRRLPTLPGRQRNSRAASGLKPTPSAPLLTVPPPRFIPHSGRSAPSCRKSSAARNPA